MDRRRVLQQVAHEAHEEVLRRGYQWAAPKVDPVAASAAGQDHKHGEAALERAMGEACDSPAPARPPKPLSERSVTAVACAAAIAAATAAHQPGPWVPLAPLQLGAVKRPPLVGFWSGLLTAAFHLGITVDQICPRTVSPVRRQRELCVRLALLAAASLSLGLTTSFGFALSCRALTGLAAARLQRAVRHCLVSDPAAPPQRSLLDPTRLNVAVASGASFLLPPIIGSLVGTVRSGLELGGNETSGVGGDGPDDGLARPFLAPCLASAALCLGASAAAVLLPATATAATATAASCVNVEHHRAAPAMRGAAAALKAVGGRPSRYKPLGNPGGGSLSGDSRCGSGSSESSEPLPRAAISVLAAAGLLALAETAYNEALLLWIVLGTGAGGDADAGGLGPRSGAALLSAEGLGVLAFSRLGRPRVAAPETRCVRLALATAAAYASLPALPRLATPQFLLPLLLLHTALGAALSAAAAAACLEMLSAVCPESGQRRVAAGLHTRVTSGAAMAAAPLGGACFAWSVSSPAAPVGTPLAFVLCGGLSATAARAAFVGARAARAQRTVCEAISRVAAPRAPRAMPVAPEGERVRLGRSLQAS